MRWSAALLVLSLTGPIYAQEVAVSTSSTQAYSSYTQAWHAAHEAERPMLVILNPADEKSAIQEVSLRADGALQPLLDQYVVAVIDTTTDHGKQVYELFQSPALPRVVVIDKQQQKQLYRTSDKLSHEKLVNVLTEYKEGVVKAPATRVVKYAQPAGYCPTCQNQKRYSF